MWSHSDALAWLYGRQALGIKLGLDKVHRLLAAVGDPHRSFRSVHIAGTNGKGSTARFVAGALHRSGYRVGLFTSPHLTRFAERIQIDDAEISNELVVQLLHDLRPHVEALDAAQEPPTFFELTTALAFLAFQHAGVEWAVIEAGMGGRLDATNVLQPEVTVITPIDLDHAEFLGDTVAAVAYEKAGIMKPGVPCITAADGEALVILKAVSHELGVPMSILGGDYHVDASNHMLRLLRPDGAAMYRVGPAGAHQAVNAATAVACCDALRLAGVALPIEAVQTSIAETVTPGRLESIPQGGVEVLLDGAHNEAGAIALRQHLADRDVAGFHLITGFAADKDWESSLQNWAPLAARVWGVPLRSGRTLDPEAMRAHVEGTGIPFTTAPSARAALESALEAGADMVLVAGSLFLVGEARAVLLGESMEEVGGSQ